MTTFILTHKERRLSPISALVSYMGAKYKFPTGESIATERWNGKTKRARVRKGEEELALLNDRLDSWQSACERAVAHFNSLSIIPPKAEFLQRVERERLGRDKSDETVLTDYFDRYINRYKDIRSANRIKQYTLVKNVVRRFETDTNCTVRFDDVDISFNRRFTAWFYNRDYSPNYLGDCLKIIRAVMREAEDVDGLRINRAIYSKAFFVPKVKTDSIYLTEQELIGLYRLKIDEEKVSELNHGERMTHRTLAAKCEAISKAMDLFLVGAYTGLRFSDYSRLSMSDCVNGCIVKYNKKTDTKTVIPIHWVIQQMIDNGFSFDIKMSEQKLNKHIKEAAFLAGITDEVVISKPIGNGRREEIKKKWELVTSHTARRSFATNAYLAGIPTIAIMKITGHMRESTFLEYIKISETENAEHLMAMDFFKGPSNGAPDGVPKTET